GPHARAGAHPSQPGSVELTAGMALLDRFSLVDRTALVTGASRGIGLAIATALAEAGAEVAINGRNADACEETVRLITGAGGRAYAAPGHVGRQEASAAIVRTARERHGRFQRRA